MGIRSTTYSNILCFELLLISITPLHLQIDELLLSKIVNFYQRMKLDTLNDALQHMLNYISKSHEIALLSPNSAQPNYVAEIIQQQFDLEIRDPMLVVTKKEIHIYMYIKEYKTL
jgi:hypothetical protein